MKVVCLSIDREFSSEVLDFARLVAQRTRGETLLVCMAKRARRSRHGPDGKDILARAEEYLQEISPLVRLEIGDPAQRIRNLLREEPADLFVLAAATGDRLLARQKSALIRRLVGQSGVPLAVVRQAPKDLKRILICTAGAEFGDKAVQRGAQLAQQLGVKATLLYVGASVPSMYTGLAEVEEELGELLASNTPIARHLLRGAEIMDEHGVEGALLLRHGVVAEQILREADANDYSLIVLGFSRARDNLLRSLLLGDVTQEVIGGSLCPVVIVR